jgi:hypothetical protein
MKSELPFVGVQLGPLRVSGAWWDYALAATIVGTLKWREHMHVPRA